MMNSIDRKIIKTIRDWKDEDKRLYDVLKDNAPGADMYAYSSRVLEALLAEVKKILKRRSKQ